MSKEFNERAHEMRIIKFAVLIIFALVLFVLALSIGHYGFLSPIRVVKCVLSIVGVPVNVSLSDQNIIQYIRLPRAIAAFFIGGALSISGLVYQNIFNNKLVSPDILGVSAGSCVGAGIAILCGLSGFFINALAFVFGVLAVGASLLLPKLFKNRFTIILVLSGIIVGSFMNSIISLIKYIADKDNKLSSITFWMMGSLSGTRLEDLSYVLAFILFGAVLLFLMNKKIDIVSFGREESISLGVNYELYRLLIIGCSTVLTAVSVSVCGTVGWVGLVVPHIARALVGSKTKYSLPFSFVFGGGFLTAVDALSRTLSVDEIPLSIITGIIGAVIYTAVLIRKGRDINE